MTVPESVRVCEPVLTRVAHHGLGQLLMEGHLGRVVVRRGLNNTTLDHVSLEQVQPGHCYEVLRYNYWVNL